MANARKKTAARATFKPLDHEAKILVAAKAENPFRENTAVYKRVNAVLKSNRKPVDWALKHGARSSTVRFLEKAKVIRLVTK